MQDTSEGEGFLQQQTRREPTKTLAFFKYTKDLVLLRRQPKQTAESDQKLRTHDDDFEEVVLHDRKPRLWKNLQLRTFITSLTGVILTILSFVFGVGCGLGIGVPYYGGSSLSHAFTRPPSTSPIGIPNDLPIIPAGQLTNRTELDLATGFVSPGAAAPRVREFDFAVAMALAAPDGVWKPMVLVNGQSPGPLIEACTGDTVRVRVTNMLPGNTSTSVHFHGIDQRGTPWADGVAGVTQCGIPPGGSFTYEFAVVGQRGTFWYHAHAGVQYTDGLYGPIVVRGCAAEGAGEEEDDKVEEMVPATDAERIVFLGENHHAYAGELVQHYLAPSSPWEPAVAGVEPLSDNLLLNGQNTFDCSVVSTTFNSSYRQNNTPECTGGQVYTTNIRPGTSMRLRLINHSSYLSYWFSIDDHPLTIVEIDGVEVEPLVSQGVHVNIGQRYSVIIKATEKVGDYTIRSALEKECFLPYSTYTSSGLESIGYQAKGILRYDHDEESDGGEATEEEDLVKEERDESTTNPWGCGDMPFDMPRPMRQEAAYEHGEGDPTHIIDFQFRQVGEINRIFLNKTSWSPYQDDATLWQAADNNETNGFAAATAESSSGGVYHNWGFRLDQQVLLVPDGSGAAQVAINSLDAMEHPFHMHGHSVQVVGWGPGRYDPSSSSSPSSATTWNLDNPLRRDTFTVPAESHVVIRFRADNPGIWVLHCHVGWHLEAGMLVSFLEGPGDLRRLVDGMDAEMRELSEGFCPKRAGRGVQSQ